MTSNVETGGPAFQTENEHQSGHSTWHHEGMSLRDYFAAKALPAILAQKDVHDSRELTNAAWVAYRIADEMLIVRQQ